jgi:hypothetical protein
MVGDHKFFSQRVIPTRNKKGEMTEKEGGVSR